MLKGSIVALVTPFLNNKVNYNKLEELIDFHIENKTDGLLLLGTTAESSTLTKDECHELVKFCISYINNKIDILVGVCTNNTKKAIDDCIFYENLGIKYFLVITPYYNQGNESGIYKHFKSIANSISSKVIIYHIPNRTGVSLNTSLIKELSLIENIIGIKESNPNFKQTIEIFSLQNDNFKIYCGNDEFIIPFLSLNADGIINVSGNIIPKEIHNIYSLYKQNKFKEALNIFNFHKNFIYSLFLETNPIGVKEAMNILSMNNDEIRLPLTNYSLQNHNTLRKEILNLGKYPNNKI